MNIPSACTYNYQTSTELLIHIINPLLTNTVNFTKFNAFLLTRPDFSTCCQSNVILVGNISPVPSFDPFALDFHYLD